MAAFEYQAVDRDGRAVTGTVLAASLDDAARSLSKRGLVVRQMSATAGAPTVEAPPPTDPRPKLDTAVLGPLIGGVRLEHQHAFFRQLGALLHAGIGPAKALDSLSRQRIDGKLQRIAAELSSHASAGRPISFGMQRYPEVFAPLTLSVIRAGERGGFLDDALKQVAEYLQSEIQMRNTIRRAITPPKLILGASIIIFLGANLIIKSLAPNSNSSLSSPLTELSSWYVLGPLLIATFIFFRYGLRQQPILEKWHRFLLHLPKVGGVVQGFATAKFGSAYRALYRAGVPLAEGIKLSADACGNEWMRAQLYSAAEKLGEGETISSVLRESNALAPVALDMIETGEQTGQLDSMLDKVAEYYEDESKTNAQILAQVFERAIFLLVAVYVGYVVIKFWTSYYGGLLGGG